jgi:hypothetical protein
MPPAAFQSPASSVRVVGGQSIAKAQWDSHERARLAAQWKAGMLSVKPTTKLAALVFGVCTQLVRQAAEELSDSAWLETLATPDAQNGGAVLNGTPVIPPNPIESAWWVGLSESARDDFVSAHADSIWASFERLTR